MQLSSCTCAGVWAATAPSDILAAMDVHQDALVALSSKDAVVQQLYKLVPSLQATLQAAWLRPEAQVQRICIVAVVSAWLQLLCYPCVLLQLTCWASRERL